MKIILITLFVCLIVGTTSITIYNYNFNTNTPFGNYRPYYDIGFIYQGNTIQVDLSITGTFGLPLGTLTITVRDKTHANPPLAVGTDTCSGAVGTTCSNTYPVLPGASANYYVTVEPLIAAPQPVSG